MSRQPLRTLPNPSLVRPQAADHRNLSSEVLSIPPDPKVPDSIDFTSLWKEVEMSQSQNTTKNTASSRGTASYDEVLYRLGIDIEEYIVGLRPSPKEIIDLGERKLHPSLSFAHLSTATQRESLALLHRRLAGFNEPSMEFRILMNLFVFPDLPDRDSDQRCRVSVPAVPHFSEITNLSLDLDCPRTRSRFLRSPAHLPSFHLPRKNYTPTFAHLVSPGAWKPCLARMSQTFDADQI